MKRLMLLLAFSCLVLTTTYTQETVRFIEWLDDENYVIEKDGSRYQVDAKTGREENYEPNSPAPQSSYVFAVEGELYFQSPSGEVPRRLTANAEPEANPTMSPDQKWVAFTRSKNLYAIDLESGLEYQLTTDGGGLISNGWASWVYYEEILGRRSRYKAFYWSQDSKKIAFLRFDDTAVPEFPIFHHEAEDMAHGMLEKTRYPKSGDPNPGVKLGIANLESGQTTWVEQNPELEYTAWTFWTPDSGELLFQQMNRDQDTLHLYAADPATGHTRLIHEETQPTWVEFYTEIDFLQDGDQFLLRSNRNGWYNIYLHHLDGRAPLNLTPVDWRVTAIQKIDEAANRLFLTGTGPQSTDQHLFVTDFKGSSPRRLTDGDGWHATTLSPGGSYFVDRFSTLQQRPGSYLYDLKGKKVRTFKNAPTKASTNADVKVEMLSIPTADGLNLPAYWVLPPNFDDTKKYPVVFRIYGGPDAGTVYNRFRDFSYDKMVRDDVILFTVDHRGSGKFGKKGLDYMHRSLGKWEMNDYTEAVKWLRKHSFIDSGRIGIQGSSYGGYLSALALTYASDYFTHGIASASVTDWRLYDNIYTERYMDTPASNPAGYDFGSVLTHADKLKGKLLIVHGTIDDNVHLQQSIQLISKLQEEGKDFEMMVYPGGRHGWGGNKRIHSQKLNRRFWQKYGFGKEPNAKP